MVGGLGARLQRGAACDAQGTHHLHDAVGGLVGLAGGHVVGLRRSGGGLGVGRVVLTEPAPVLAVGSIYLDDPHSPGPQETREPQAEAAAALDADAAQDAEPLDPCHEFGVARFRRRYALAPEASAESVERHANVVHVRVGVNPERDEPVGIRRGERVHRLSS